MMWLWKILFLTSIYNIPMKSYDHTSSKKNHFSTSLRGYKMSSLKDWPWNLPDLSTKDWTCVSCGSYIAGSFFTAEPPGKPLLSHNTCEVSGQARHSFSVAYQSQSGFLWQLAPHLLQDTGANGTLGRVLCSFTFVLSKGHVCEHAEFLQSCLILCNPMDCSPPGSSVHGIL